MLVALTPGAADPGSSEPTKRIAELEQKVAQLEADKRRGERLLLLTSSDFAPATRRRRKASYTPMPHVLPELRERYEGVVGVISGTTTVSEAAPSLRLKRNHFQTVMPQRLFAAQSRVCPRSSADAPLEGVFAALRRGGS